MSRTVRIGLAALALVAVGAVGVIGARAEGDLHLHRIVRSILGHAHQEAPTVTTPTAPAATPPAPKG